MKTDFYKLLEIEDCVGTIFGHMHRRARELKTELKREQFQLAAVDELTDEQFWDVSLICYFQGQLLDDSNSAFWQRLTNEAYSNRGCARGKGDAFSALCIAGHRLATRAMFPNWNASLANYADAEAA